MEDREVLTLLGRLVDGQSIRVLLASGAQVDAIFNAEYTSLDDGLYFDTMEGKELRADWENIKEVSFRSARLTVGSRFVVPPEHPLSGHGPVGTTPEGLPRKPFTTRNR